MTSILISSDDPQIGEDIAHRLAQDAGFDYVGQSLLDEIAKQKDVTRNQLEWALEGTGGRRLSKPQRALLQSYIQTATLEALMKDNVVCFGLAAHLHVYGVSHLLHLRVLANPAERHRALTQDKGYSDKKAAKVLEKERGLRSRHTLESFGVDECDPALYDIVVQLKQISPERVIQIVRDTAELRGFATMTYSRNCLADLLRASRIREALLPEFQDLRVVADGDRVIVHVKCSNRVRNKVIAQIKETASAVENVTLVEVHTVRNLREVSDGRDRDPGVMLYGE